MSTAATIATVNTVSVYENPQKIAARSENVKLYRQLSGVTSIPAGQEYWTLASRQSTSLDSEIEQMVAAGLLTKNQFHGVDRDAGLIEANRLDHPDAYWHAGSWNAVIPECSWSPALVYLDTTGMAACVKTANLVTGTMRLSPAGTVLLVNVMLDNPYAGTEDNPMDLLQNIVDRCTEEELDVWGFDDLLSFEYSSGLTRMLTIAMRRRS